MQAVPITYFSDVLCVWAYIAQLRVNAVKEKFADKVRFEKRFVSVFGATERKIATVWRDKGEYAGFNAHLREVGQRFPEVRVNPDIWLTVRPASSNAPHLFLKAAQLAEAAGEVPAGSFEVAVWAFRQAFFEAARDIARRDVQVEIARAAGLDPAPVEALIHDGRAHAALALDYQDADALGLQGSPSFVLNEGRQKLYGNVGYRVIEANIEELLRAPSADQASWC
jgi:predicted DsbA family dithiol-disulfide isomerase